MQHVHPCSSMFHSYDFKKMGGHWDAPDFIQDVFSTVIETFKISWN